MTKSSSSLEEHPYCKREEEQEEGERRRPPPPAMEWSENFQDLSIFCNFGSKPPINTNMTLPSGEQLDTPIITVNDEFDFSQRSCSRVTQQQQQHQSADDDNPWADLNLQQHPPDNNNSQQPSTTDNNNVKQWQVVTDWLCADSPKQIDYEPPSESTNFAAEDDHKNFADAATFGEEEDHHNNFADTAKIGQHFSVRPPLTKLDHEFEKDPPPNFDASEDDFVVEEILNKEQTIDIVELLKSANNRGELLKSGDRVQYLVAGGGKTIPVTGISNSDRLPGGKTIPVTGFSNSDRLMGGKTLPVTSNSNRLPAGKTIPVTGISNSDRLMGGKTLPVTSDRLSGGKTIPVTGISNSDRLMGGKTLPVTSDRLSGGKTIPVTGISNSDRLPGGKTITVTGTIQQYLPGTDTARKMQYSAGKVVDASNRMQYSVAGSKLVTDTSNSSRMQQYPGKKVLVTEFDGGSRMQYACDRENVANTSSKMQYSGDRVEGADNNSSRLQYSGDTNKVADNNSSRLQYSGDKVADMEYSLIGGNNSNKLSNRMDYSFVGNKEPVTVSVTDSSSREVLRNSLMLKKDVNIRKNSRHPLSAMFKTEEPSLFGAKNLKTLVLPSVRSGEVIELGSASPGKSEVIFGEDFVMPEIKIEPEEVEEEEGEKEIQVAPFKAPQKKLKLDIRSANNPLGLGGPVLTPTTTAAVLGESLDTPDVLKPLLEGIDGPSFDLIKYCEVDELAGIPSPLVVDNTRKTIPKKVLANYSAVKIEEGYEIEREREPLSTIKEEDITTDDSLPVARNSNFAAAGNSNSKVLPPRKKVTPTRKRRKTNFENYDSEISSDAYVDNEDDDETFHLPPKVARFGGSKSKSISRQRKTSIVASPGNRKVSSSGVDSDQESIMSQDRYRELRDRNNEASKRSRMNRKSREMEMKEKAEEMERRNKFLKARANHLDKMVETFREVIFKLAPRNNH
ncbi:uncharacterized protein LOC111063490 [Nilaparvata lugens]|uniref:uncharacterized protein LOC111063490 n=1 Tax=Nilaparvata lugens TaxID=108931 RepID=UPI00193DA79A|nr:uncharacterized protein LOC111063490 [Nilaparvata lugens]XP_039290920.1 uncharacterized protein LOC111063490 [Nilaparvata lugens]XP_039290921.1 uncharacterized protein LOC111063490 [Nilaparvata lugens]XP_039290922.1 uncharacterized protein LOC111063490 [Nilaparvata lugens]